MKYIILSNKEWNAGLAEDLSSKYKADWIHIKSKFDFSYNNLKKINPEKIFIPHWSNLIPEDISKGEEFTSKNIRIIRPGNGLEPKYFELVIGRKAKLKLKKGTPLNWDLLL